MSNDVYIIGVGMIKFGKFLERSIKDMTGQALDEVLKDCDLTRDDIEAAWFSNTGWGIYTFQHSIRGQVALTANGLQGIPVTNVENACASASTALNGAWMAVKAGLYDCALAIGAEKQYHEDRALVMRSFMAGTDVEEMARTVAQLQQEEQKRREQEANEKGTEVQQEQAGGHSAFMDFYAAGARAHMKMYGSTQRQLAVIAAKNHNNSTLNPLAQYTFPQTVEQVLNDRIVSYPLTRAMCAPIGDGAAAAIVCSEEFLRKHSSKRAIKIRASVLEGGKRTGQGDISERAAKKAFEYAGLGPEDVDVMEVHDATAFGEVSVMEALGFCPRGEGGVMAERGDTALDGRIPVNPSGGLISRGHPVGASGLAQIYELVTQLRGEAGKRQVKSHRIAMTENGGGTVGAGEAAMTIHILEKV
jgi:acetyl-CoA acyltransferase